MVACDFTGYTMCMKFLAAVLLSFGLLFTITTSADAATLYWVGADGADASVASNWKLTNPTTCGGGDSPVAPTSADTISFDADCDNGATIDADFSSTIGAVVLGNGYAGTVSLARPLTVSGVFTHSGGTWNSGGNALSISGIFTLNNALANFIASSGTTIFNNNFTITAGTFTHNSGVVNFAGGSAALNCNSQSFNTVSFTGQAGTKTIGSINNCVLPLGTNPVIPTSITLNNAVIKGTGILTMSAGTITLNHANASVQDFNALSVASLVLSTAPTVVLDMSMYSSFVATGIVTINTGTLTFSNTANTVSALTINGGTVTHTAGVLTLGATRVQGGTLTLANGADLNSGLIISSGTFNAPSGSMSLASSLTVTNYPSTVTFNNNGGTIVFDGTSGTMACGNLPFSKIVLANTGSTKTIGADCTLPLGANPTIGAGGGVSVAGTLDGTGTLTATAGTVTLTTGSALTNFTGLTLNNLTLNNVSPDFSGYGIFTLATSLIMSGTSTLSLPHGADINGSVTVGSGSVLNAPSGSISIGRNFLTEGGTFNHNNGTVILDSASASQILSGSNTFYNLTKIGSGSNASLTGTAGGTQTILNNLVLKGTANALLPIDSTVNGSQWNIDAQGTRDMAYLFVRDSNNINATTMEAGAGSFDNGNNTNWSFPVNTRYMVSTGVTYPSTLDELDLKMDIGYDSTLTNAPVLLILHGHSSIFSGTDIVQRLAKKGIFAIQTYKRGFNGSEGVSDDGGREIQDFVDAVEYVKANYGSYVDENNINVAGYSGGGGNAYGLVTKFPDYFNSAQIFFGMSDYGHDPQDSWWYNGASTSQKNIMSTRIGGTPTDVPDNYYSRALYLGAKNNPDTNIQLFYDTAEAVVPPVNATQYTTVATAAGLTNTITRISDSNTIISELNETFTTSTNDWVFLGGGASGANFSGGVLNWTTTRGPVFDVMAVPFKSLRNYGPTNHVKASFDVTLTSAAFNEGGSAALSLRNSNNILLQNTVSMLIQEAGGVITLYLRADYNDTAFASGNRTLQAFTTPLTVGTPYTMELELNNTVLTGGLKNASGTIIETQSFTLDGTKTFVGIDSFGISNFVASAGTETMSGTIDNIVVDAYARYIHGAPQEGEEGREGNITAENYFVPGMVAGMYAQPMLATTDDMFIPGFIKTKEFEVFLGNGNDEAGEIEYDISGNTKTFTIEPLTGTSTLSLKVKNLSANAKYVVVQGDATTEMTTDSNGSVTISGSLDASTTYEITPVKAPSRVVGGSYRPPSTTPVVPVTPTTPVTDTTCKPGDLFSAVTGARCSVSTTTPTTPSVPGTAPTFTRSLSLGMSGEDVKALQIYLNQKGFTVSTIGAGSVGKETTYFGPATKAAVIKFQLANKIVPAAGFFGPITRNFIATH